MISTAGTKYMTLEHFLKQYIDSVSECRKMEQAEKMKNKPLPCSECAEWTPSLMLTDVYKRLDTIRRMHCEEEYSQVAYHLGCLITDIAHMIEGQKD